jgi:G:T-mismatch repair DNA endonuclease (very short patch repair protein)
MPNIMILNIPSSVSNYIAYVKNIFAFSLRPCTQSERLSWRIKITWTCLLIKKKISQLKVEALFEKTYKKHNQSCTQSMPVPNLQTGILWARD